MGKRREGIIGAFLGVLLTALVGIVLVLALGIHRGSEKPSKGLAVSTPVRNGGSGAIQCGGDPVGEDRVIGLSKATGSADCTTAILILAHCGAGNCDHKTFTLEGNQFFCVTRVKAQGPPGASAIRSWTCVGPGQSVEWTDSTKGV